VIACAGALAGGLDISAAFISTYLSSGRGPVFLLQFIASGLFGKAAFSGGLPMAAAGLLIHFLLALGWSALFVLAYCQTRILSRNAAVSGNAYGLLVWLAMNLVVLPITRAPRVSFSPKQTILSVLYVVFLVGLTISMVVKRQLGNRKTS
jgi:uncharacterized membrane protein YagU involved in acid resistance